MYFSKTYHFLQNMKYSTEIITFKSYLDSAFKDAIPWTELAELMNNLCNTLEKSKEANILLLDELKLYKDLYPYNEDSTDFKDEEDVDPLCKVKVELPEESNLEKNELNHETQESFEEYDLKQDEMFVDNSEYFSEDDNEEFESENNKSKKKLKPSQPKTYPKVKCSHCDKLISSKNLSQHIKEQHKTFEEFPCDKCEKVFKIKQLLQRHQKRMHEETPTRLQCDQCDKTFKYGNSLRDHVKIEHEGIKDSFSCEECGKTFSRYMSLKLHIKGIHQKERNFKCDKCPSTFLLKQSLERHFRTVHEGAEDFVCPECGKAVTSAGG